MNLSFLENELDPQLAEILIRIGKVLIVLLFGFLMSRIFNFWIQLVYRNSVDRQRLFILQKLSKYSLAIVTALLVLKIFGVDFKSIFVAAGVLSIALGFAAQTSVSNLISGLFLIFEKPFIVGDFIEVAENKGEVLSIDLLSMRIKTTNNLLVRVPNESVMKSTVINYSHFPIRRYDLIFAVSYKEDLEKIRRIVLDIVENNPYCLDAPDPVFTVEKMADYFLDIKVGVWGESKNILNLQTTFCQDMRSAFIRNNVELPQRSMRLEMNPFATPQTNTQVPP